VCWGTRSTTRSRPSSPLQAACAGRLDFRSRNITEEDDDFARGLEVIEDRAESLNRFLQAYRELMGLPAPRLEAISLAAVIKRVAKLETRLAVDP
jgi:two-component system nitrogen regulation sensor histidine kinase NtrY